MMAAKSNPTISVSIDKDVKVLLEKYAKEIDLTLSRFARNLIYVSIDSYALKLFTKSGATKLVVPFRAMLDSIPAYKEKIDKKIAYDAENSVTISVAIDADIKEELEKIADEVGLPLKTFARNLIYVALDDFKLLRKVGVIRLAVSFRDFLDKFQNYEFQNDKRFLATK